MRRLRYGPGPSAGALSSARYAPACRESIPARPCRAYNRGKRRTSGRRDDHEETAARPRPRAGRRVRGRRPAGTATRAGQAPRRPGAPGPASGVQARSAASGGVEPRGHHLLHHHARRAPDPRGRGLDGWPDDERGEHQQGRGGAPAGRQGGCLPGPRRGRGVHSPRARHHDACRARGRDVAQPGARAAGARGPRRAVPRGAAAGAAHPRARSQRHRAAVVGRRVLLAEQAGAKRRAERVGGGAGR